MSIATTLNDHCQLQEQNLVILMDDEVIHIGHRNVKIELAVHKREFIAISYSDDPIRGRIE